MQEWIVDLKASLPVGQVGRKSAALGQLIAAGFPIPQSVCITTDAFIAATKQSGELRLPDRMLETLCQTLPMDVPLVVRSSAVLEDLPETSLAGRYSTSLNVKGKVALEQAILDCWRSYFAVQPDKEDGGMAVLIQPLIDAECAGVCFTVDPVRLQPENLLVVSGWGLGAGVVGGSVPTDTARLRRFDLKVEEISIANKHTAVRPAATGSVTSTSVANELCNIPCLPDDWLHRIAEFALTVEQVFAVPQDIEWAIADGQVWILQSRPITALPVEAQEAVRYPIQWENDEEPQHYWWLVQVGDGTGTPAMPAMLDFARLSIRGGQDAIYFGGGDKTRWRKEVNGRAYWTVANAPSSPGHQRVYRAALLELYKRLRQQNVTPWEYWGPEVMNATRRLAAFDANKADAQALADHLEEAIATSIRHWMQHTIGPGRPIRDAELLKAYARIVGRQPDEVASEIPFLLSGMETIQTRLVESLYDLACLAKDFPDETNAIALNSKFASQDTSPGLEAFAHAFQKLIAEYGHRVSYRHVPGYPVELPLPWREVTENVWEMVSAYLPLARQGGLSPREVRVQAKNAMDQHVDSLCTSAVEAGVEPAHVEDFRHKLSYARRNAFSLDENNHYIDQLSEGQFIQALLHAGRWLAANGYLPNSLDVFWLYAEEVLAALRGFSDGLDATIAVRRAEFKEWQALLPPACLGLPDRRLPERPANPDRQVNPAYDILPAKKLKGETASRGRASGRARRIEGEALPTDLDPGDILVAPFAGPVLIPVLPAIAAVVLDYGGPGDHFAITAREFGLPAVCGTLHATRLIPEGAQVIVDAVAGIVSWE